MDYNFNFNEGILKVNSIDAKSIKLNDVEIPVINKNSDLVVNSLQIGNILLKAVNGNLSITVVSES